MTSDELETLLEAGAETPQVDYKGSCKWSAETFAKDILAMANGLDGGWLIIGVKENKDGSFTRTGITDSDAQTYKIDNMKDLIAQFADPFIDFSSESVADKQGLKYVVLRVEPFQEIPVICRQTSKDTKAGVIYYRNTNRRVESASVSNSYDMRDIIERSAVKLWSRAKKIGYPIKDNSDIAMEAVKKALQDEIGDL